MRLTQVEWLLWNCSTFSDSKLIPLLSTSAELCVSMTRHKIKMVNVVNIVQLCLCNNSMLVLPLGTHDPISIATRQILMLGQWPSALVTDPLKHPVVEVWDTPDGIIFWLLQATARKSVTRILDFHPGDCLLLRLLFVSLKFGVSQCINNCASIYIWYICHMTLSLTTVHTSVA